MSRNKFKNLGYLMVIGGMVLSIPAQAKASEVVPKMIFTQTKVNTNTTDLEVGIQNIKGDIVAIELEFSLKGLESISQVTNNIKDSYITYTINPLSNAEDKVTAYIVSENKNTPLALNGDLLSFSIKPDITLELDDELLRIKVIEEGYITNEYTDIELVHNKQGNQDSSTGGGNTGNTTSSNPSTPDVKFDDIKGHWAKESIEKMARLGFIKGYEDGSFKPNRTMTRGEFVVLLARTLNVPASSELAPLSDVESGKWYTNAINGLYKLGVITGLPDGTFGVNEPITNEQLCTMLYRALLAFNVNPSLNNLQDITFIDSEHISKYAMEAVAMLQDRKIINGGPDGKFMPKTGAMRAQAVLIMDRVLTNIKL